MKNKLILLKNEFVRDDTYEEAAEFDISKVLYINRPDKYVMFHCEDNIFEYRGSLIEVENVLPDNFCRVHNEYIVNLYNMVCLCSDYIDLKNGIKIPVSRRRRKYVEEFIEKYNSGFKYKK